MKLYPTTSQDWLLWETLRLHCRLYNAALEERIGAWQKQRVSISFADQCRSLTQIRADMPEYAALNAQSCQVTLDRLEKAMKAFYRRIKTGETPGFPRFRSLQRFPGWGYKTAGDGFSFTPGTGWRHGRLRLSGIGEIRCRGEARTPGEVIRADIQRKADGWFVSLVVLCEPYRETDAERGIEAYDWGIETWLTIARETASGNPLEAAITEIANPRIGVTERVKGLQRQLAGRTKRSGRYRKKAKEIGRARRREANARKDAVHKVAAAMVRRCHTIITEELTPARMTRSARGTVEEPGRNVRQKAGLNREILAAVPGLLNSTIASKAAEAATHLIVLDTRSAAPSQHCPRCWARCGKPLEERVHACASCGWTEPRDHASARWMLALGTGRAMPQRKGRPARNAPARLRASRPKRGEPKRETPIRAVQSA